MSNLLHTKRGVTNLPLSYVIHKANTTPNMDHLELIIYNVSLTNAGLKYDRKNICKYTNTSFCGY